MPDSLSLAFSCFSQRTRCVLREIRAGIARYAAPFNIILERAPLPAAVETIDGYYCIAEAIISAGRQCKVEGYVWKDEVVVYGVIDSLREGLKARRFHVTSIRQNCLRASSIADDFSSVQGETLWGRGFRRGDWRVRTVSRTRLSSTPAEFVVHAELDAYEDGKRIFSKNWSVKIPRDLV